LPNSRKNFRETVLEAWDCLQFKTLRRVPRKIIAAAASSRPDREGRRINANDMARAEVFWHQDR
jgi:hypothetical protein